MPNITNLLYSNTFKQWFDRTNTVIDTVNGITVHNLFAGDGIGVTSSGNLFTVSHGTAVTTGVTFSGNVKFNGTVEFASSPTISSMVVSVSPKISGITAGNVVRIGGSGLTLARANTPANSEVLGMIVGESASSNIVALSGVINNNTISSTIANSLGIVGGTLIAGQAYFLNPDVAGGITINEPQIYGQVSKPVILGISGGLGSLLAYRGIQIEGISAGITAELDDKIIVQVNYDTTADNPVALNVGDPFFYVKDNVADAQELADVIGTTLTPKLLGKINGSTNKIAFVPHFTTTPTKNWQKGWNFAFTGLISKIISHNSSTKVYLLEITIPGGSFNALISDLDNNWFRSTSQTAGLFLRSDYLGLDSADAKALSTASKFVDFIKIDASNAKIILSSRTTTVGVGAALPGLPPGGGMTASVEYDNLIPNGAFTIWQRQVTSLTAGSLNDYSTPFADRWFVIEHAASGLTATFSREEFVSDQISVPGSPLYYTDISVQHSAVTSEYRPRLENIQKEARLLQEQEVTVSFWAKSTVDGVTLDIVYNRYEDSYANTVDVETALDSRILVSAAGITLSALWDEYVYTFVPTVAGFTLSSTESGWFSFGFEFPSNTATISLAQVQLELGDSVSGAIYVSPERELERCMPYYMRTYDWDQSSGSTEPSRLNEETLQLGNLITQTDYAIKFPTEVHNNTPTVTLYSPSTGQEGDAFNTNTGQDMRYSGDGLVNLPWDSTTSRTTAAWPSPNISVSSVSKNGMHVHISNGATHLDTLKFHYVADADLDLNV